MNQEHNNIWCGKFADRVFPNALGNCSLCGACLHELTIEEAIQLVDRFEEIALERTAKDRWDASDWLFDDEASALVIAKAVMQTQRR
jgi:hypothetical protein